MLDKLLGVGGVVLEVANTRLGLSLSVLTASMIIKRWRVSARTRVEVKPESLASSMRCRNWVQRLVNSVGPEK